MNTEDAWVETLRDGYSFVSWFCTGASIFECDNNSPTLKQNGEVEICLTPNSTDTKIFHFALNIDQENNSSPMLPIPPVTNNGNRVQYTYPLTDINKSVDTKKVTAMVLGILFDQLRTGRVTTLPPIKFNGTVDLNFHTVPCGRQSCYGVGDEGEWCNTFYYVQRVYDRNNLYLNPVTLRGRRSSQEGIKRRLIENATIVWDFPSAGLRRSQEGNKFDQDPTNAATADNGVAAQAEFGLLAQIKRSTNKEVGEGVFETKVPDDVPSAAHVYNH